MREHFDAEASRLREYYDADASRRDGGSIQEWKRIERERFVGAVRIIGAAAQPRVLELGSGTGRDAQYFAEECGFTVECLDLSPKMVAKCQRRGLSATACDFTVAGTIGSVAAEGSLDAVYAMNSLLHVPKRQLSALLSEVASTLRPGGVFFVGLYGGEDFEGRWHADPSGYARFFAYYTDEALGAALCPPSSDLFTIHSFERADPGTRRPGTRGGSTQLYFQSVVLMRATGTVAVAAREPRPPEWSRSERAELSARSAWTWDACTWDGVMRWRSFLSWSLVPAWMDIGDRVVVTCHAAGDRCGQPATVVRRVLSVPLSFLDTYQIAFADGSTMFITRNNLSLQAREFHNLLGCISENSV
mmetsp:Transcript_21932/g.44806  ORF Transcript_21932/g.44806 Transcript_21932/m.44806 type:complete len:360 (-) Transcript_21932:110-1189(-)